MIFYKLIKNTPRIVSICSRRQFYINKDISPLFYSTFQADRQQLLVSCKVSPGETYDDDDAGTGISDGPHFMVVRMVIFTPHAFQDSSYNFYP